MSATAFEKLVFSARENPFITKTPKHKDSKVFVLCVLRITTVHPALRIRLFQTSQWCAQRSIHVYL